ncbi:MAG: hypothetical protein LAT83_09575 [Kiritimatiellae bacterium]|nr:hypothetical protein [Kiritimatiellia bacterium]
MMIFKTNTYRPAPMVMGLILSFSMVMGPQMANADQDDRLDHRKDYRMESISGGAFRNYVSTHVTEDDLWARSMRTFGSFHNHMHELMSHMAKYGVEVRGDREHVPEFTHRISGGEWARYRESLEEAGDDSDWYELVRITEIMHDRVHHAMARSLVYDRDSRNRDVDLGDFLRGEALAHGAGIPDAGERRISEVSLDAFREWAWRYETEPPHLHESVQGMVVFAHLLDDLLTQWLAHGDSMAPENCRPQPGLLARRGEGWSDYLAQIEDCEDAEWREFVKVAGLMRDRIHHMMHKMKAYQK